MMDGCPSAPVDCKNTPYNCCSCQVLCTSNSHARPSPLQAFPVPQACLHEMGVVHLAWRYIPMRYPLKSRIFFIRCCIKRRLQREDADSTQCESIAQVKACVAVAGSREIGSYMHTSQMTPTPCARFIACQATVLIKDSLLATRQL